ncbi:hypothetical protein M427DRAFT_135423 [Gonapodya prolifera JEL478]|uniref:F-box domain-containing protein n=1 Tax=Gonapodya prolifera (strain JEL478) TaxID=1344416 RepID=A0A139ADU7_GONPJ|nr:hypothetical protein M427DRAFT_135423 [Gonapodya prolifera JEL478]|eukprot:KXS14971.1 hypothetical protein M427DRAFT_135423 [Gonapodya prolifera JEL478]
MPGRRRLLLQTLGFIGALSDEVLLGILEWLPVVDLLEILPFVSQRFRRLARYLCNPKMELVCKVQVHLNPSEGLDFDASGMCKMMHVSDMEHHNTLYRRPESCQSQTRGRVALTARVHIADDMFTFMKTSSDILNSLHQEVWNAWRAAAESRREHWRGRRRSVGGQTFSTNHITNTPCPKRTGTLSTTVDAIHIAPYVQWDPLQTRLIHDFITLASPTTLAGSLDALWETPVSTSQFPATHPQIPSVTSCTISSDPGYPMTGNLSPAFAACPNLTSLRIHAPLLPDTSMFAMPVRFRDKITELSLASSYHNVETVAELYDVLALVAQFPNLRKFGQIHLLHTEPQPSLLSDLTRLQTSRLQMENVETLELGMSLSHSPITHTDETPIASNGSTWATHLSSLFPSVSTVQITLWKSRLHPSARSPAFFQHWSRFVADLPGHTVVFKVPRSKRSRGVVDAVVELCEGMEKRVVVVRE